MKARRSGSISGFVRRILASLTGAAFFVNLASPAVFAGPVAPVAPGPTGSQGSVDLNLSSTTAATSAALTGRTVNIQVGDTGQTVTSGSLVTPAQQLAVMQVLATGKQSILLNNAGAAVGGSFNLGSTFNYDVSNLVIPRGVTSIANTQNLNILGNLTNSGILNIHSLINAPAIVNATNITNNIGALITSNTALSLIASGNITNAGSILSSSSLSLTAGNSISNIGQGLVSSTLPASDASKTAGVIQAGGNLNLITNNLTNSGLLRSVAGNINVASALPGNILVDNTGGVLSAIKGDVNVRDAAFTGKHNFSLVGGDVLANNLNIWSGTGIANVNINDVTAAINISAGEAHVVASTDNLKLGTMNILGDPTYFNTTGSITINSLISTTGADLAIVAAGDILTAANPPAAGISTVPTANANGGNILLMAGTAFTVAPPPASGPFNNPAGTNSGSQGIGDSTSTLTVTGASATGGKIDFSLQPITISSNGNGAGATNGGNVTLLAFPGTATNSGTVNLSTGSITTGGTSTGKAGNVVILAGAAANPSATLSAINVGTINASTPGGSGSGGGSVVLATATPVVNGSTTILNGVATGAFTTGTVNPTSISVGAVTTTLSPFIAVAGSNVALGGNVVTGGTGGDVDIFARGNITGAAVTQINTAGTGTTAGRVLMVAGTSVPSNPVQLTLSPPATPVQVVTSITPPATALSPSASINLPGASITGAPVALMAGSNVTVGSTISTNGSTSSGGVTVVAGGNVTAGTTSITSSYNSTAGGIIVAAGVSGLAPTITQAYDSNSNNDAITTAVSVSGPLAASSTVTVGSVSAAQAPVFLAAGSNITTSGAVTSTSSNASIHPLIIISGGNLTLGGNVGTSGADIGLFARGNITGTTATSVSANGGANIAGSVLLAAGTAALPVLTQTNDFTTAVATVTASVASQSVPLAPGAINLPLASVTGAPVMAIASGNIALGGSSITTNGSPNGGVTLLAGGSITGPTSSVTTTNGGATGTGTVTMVAGTNVAGSTFSEVYNSGVPSLAVTTSLQSSGPLAPNASLSVAGISTNGAPVTLVAGSGVTLGGVNTTNGVQYTGQRGPGGNFLVVSGGNISGAATSISTASTTAPTQQGSNATLIAGALSRPVITQTYVNSPSPAEAVNAAVTVSGASTGGSISLPSLTTLTTVGNSAAAAGSAGGNVQLIAFAGSTASTGQISMPLVTISTGAVLNPSAVSTSIPNPSGDVLILAGGTSGTTINLGNVNTVATGTGQNNGGGAIIISTAAPKSSGLPYSYAFQSQNTSSPFSTTLGAFSPGPTLNGSAIIGNLSAAGGSALIQVSGVTVAPPTPITVTVGQSLTIGSVSNTNNALPAGGVPGVAVAPRSSSTTTITAGGVMTFTSGASITSNAAPAGNASTVELSYGVDGGSITLSAQSYVMTSAVPVSANATGGFFPGTTSFGGVDFGGGNGGIISITTTGTAASSTITVGPSNFQLTAKADTTGGNGGTVSLNSGSAINITVGSSNLNVSPTLNPLPLTGSGALTLEGTGKGGTLNLTAATNLFSTGTLDVSGAPSTLNGAAGYPGGSGGVINITVNSTSPFNIGGAVAGATANGIAASGILSANGNAIAAGATAAFGSGGSISVTNLNAGAGGTAGVIVQANSIQVQAAAATGSALGVGNASYPGGTGGTINLNGATVLSLGSLNADGGAYSAIQPGGSGGEIRITSNSFNTFVVNPAAPPTTTKNGVIGSLSASGNVGTATITGSGFASSHPSGSGGLLSLTNNGGGITLAAGAGMSVAAAAAQALLGTKGGDGGSIILSANGAVSSAISLDASGGADATFSSTTPDTISTAGPGPFNPVTINNIVSTGGFFLGQSVQVSAGANSEVVSIVAVPTSSSIQVNAIISATPYVAPTISAYFQSGNGGKISITSNSTTAFNVNSAPVGTNGVTGTLTANGYNGGTIAVTNRGAVGGVIVASGAISASATAPTTQPSPFTSFGGTGGNIAIQALGSGAPVKILGPLSVNGTNNPTTTGSVGVNYGGNGGNILITSNSSSQFVLNAPVPTTTAPLLNGIVGALSANGGNGLSNGGNAGSISVVNLGAGGGIKVNAGGLSVAPGISNSAAGNGGAISLQAPGAGAQVFISGPLSANGGSVTDLNYSLGVAGSISITSNSFNPFIVNTGATTTNGITGQLSATGWNGGSITIVNLGTGGILVGNGQLSVAAQPGAVWNNQITAGNGGSISLQAPLGRVFVSGGLDVSGGIQNTTGAYYVYGGSGGQIAIVSNSATAFNVGFATSTGNGTSGSLNANGFNGGVVSITNLGTGGIIYQPSLAPSPNIMVGGDLLNYYCQSCSAPMIPVPGVGTVEVVITGGNAGSIYLNAGVPNGASGNIYIGTNLRADGFHAGVGSGTNVYDNVGNGGIIAVTTNSVNTFNLGNAAAPGAGAANTSNGSALGVVLSANGYNGGSVGVKNFGAGFAGLTFLPSAISVSAAGGATATTNPGALPGGNGGNIDLQAPNGTLSYFNGTLSADAAKNTAPSNPQKTASGGTITLNAKLISPTSAGQLLTLSAIGDSNTGYAGLGGSVFITQSSTINTLTVGSNGLNIKVQGSPQSPVPSSTCPTCVKTGGTIMVTANGGIIVSGKLNTYDTSLDKNNLSGSITLNAPGTVGITGDSSGKVYTGNLTMNTGSGGIGTLSGVNVSYLNTRVLSLTATTSGTPGCVNCGNIFVNNSGADQIIVQSAAALLGAVNIKSDSGIIVNGPISAALTVTLQATDDSGNGNITLNGSVRGQSIKVDAAGAIQNATFAPTAATALPDSFNWLPLASVAGFYAGERIQLSGVTTDPIATSLTINVSETQTIKAVDTVNNAILLSGVTYLYNSAPTVSNAPGTGSGILASTGISNQAVGNTLNAGSAGVGSATSAIQSSGGFLTLNVTGGGSTNVYVNNNGNVLVSAGSTSNVNNLSITGNGAIATIGAITSAANITLSNGAGNDSSPIIIGGLLGAGSAIPNSTVTIGAGGSIVQLSSSAVIQANSINMASQNGNIGLLTRTISSSNVYTPGGVPLFVNVTANGVTPGSITANANNVTNLGSVYSAGTINISNSSAGVTVNGLVAGSDILFTTTGLTATTNLTISGSVNSQLGAVTFLNSGSAGAVQVNSNITAAGGPLVIQNNNAGNIAVAAGVTLSGVGWIVDGQAVNFGTVATVNYPVGVALLGANFPASLVGGPPTTVTNIVQQGNTTIPVFYGSPGTVTAAATVTVNTGLTSNANAGSVAFQASGAGAINLGSGVIINSNAVVPVLSTLDLSNTNAASTKVITAIRALQAQPGSGVTGSLTTAGTGTVNFDTTAGYNPAMLVNLKTINIPASTVVTLANFSGLSPLGVNTPTGILNSVINGQIKFLGVTNPGGTPVANNYKSEGQTFFNSAVPGNVLTINPNAVLSSDNNLTVNVGGGLSLVVGKITGGGAGVVRVFTGAADASVPAAQFNLATTPGGLINSIVGTITAGVVGNPGTVDIRGGGGILLSSSTVTATDMTFTAGGANYVVTTAGLPLMIASSQISSQASGVAARNLTVRAGTNFLNPGVTSNIVLNSGGVATFNVENLTLNVDNSPVVFSQAPQLGLAGSTLSSLSVSSNGAPSITTGNGGSITTIGNVSCASCVFTTLTVNNLNTIATTNPLGSISITAVPGSSLLVTQSSGSTNGSIIANAGLALTGSLALAVVGGNLTTLSGPLSLISSSAGVTVSSANVTAGSFVGTPQSVLLKPSDIAGAGTLSVSGPGAVNINGSSSLQSIGSNIVVSSATSTINLQAILVANGGYIQVTTGGNITGSGSTITANAVGTVATNSYGGGLLFNSGGAAPVGVSSLLTNAYTYAPGVMPYSPLFQQPSGVSLPLGSNVNINNNANGSSAYGTGAILSTVASTANLNLNNAATFPATLLNVSGGAMIFNAGGASSTLFDSSTFTVNAFTPIKAARRVGSTTEIVIDDSSEKSKDAQRIANVFVPGHSGAQILTTGGMLSANNSAAANAVGVKNGSVSVTLKSGTMVMNPLCDATINAGLAQVLARKGSVVSVAREAIGVRVAACSGPGHVTVVVAGKSISLAPGEELVVSEHVISQADHSKADGIGRRNFHNYAVGTGLHAGICDISLVSVLANVRHLQVLRNPQNAIERKIAESVLRSAAAVGMVTQSRGAYHAVAPAGQPEENVFTPVSMINEAH